MPASLLAADGTEAARPLAAESVALRGLPADAASQVSPGGTGRNARSAPRFEALDALRWIASIQIVFSHFYIDGHRGRPHRVALPGAGEWWPQFALYGSNWTQFFFILSGFVLGYAEMARPAGATRLSQLQYVRKRLIAIYPTHVFALLVYALQLNVSGHVTSFMWASLPPTLLLLQSWVVVCADSGFETSASSWNVPCWFLSALMLYWLTLRSVAGFFRARCLSATSLYLFMLWACSLIPGILVESLADPTRGVCLYVNLRLGSIGYFHVFFAGVAAARLFILTCLRDSETGGAPAPGTRAMVLKPEQAPWFFRYGCCIGFAAYMTFYLLVDEEVMFLAFHNGGLIPIMVLMIFGAAVGDDPLVRHVLRQKPFVVLGQLSYAQYLMQFPAFLFVTRCNFAFRFSEGDKILFPLVLLLVGYLVQRYVQRPYTEWQRWRQQRGVVGTDERVIAWAEGLGSSLLSSWRGSLGPHPTEAATCQAGTCNSPGGGAAGTAAGHTNGSLGA